MKRRFSPRLVSLCGLLWAITPRAALAADRACTALAIESDAALRERWPDLIPRIRDDLQARDDLDACAHVSLSLRADTAIGVTVALPDGRSASRTVQRLDDVSPTLQALLLVPEPTHAESARTATRILPKAPRRTRTRTGTGTRTPTRTPARPTAEGRDVLGSASTISGTGLGIELSVVTGARIGDGQASFGLGAVSFLNFSGWLLGFGGRVDGYRPLSGGPSDAALELGVLLGRRIRFPTVTLDVVAGPGIAIKGEMSDRQVLPVQMPAVRPAEPPPESSSGPVPRLLAGARLGFSPDSILRTFVGIEAAFGPARAEGSPSPNSPSLPNWTLGLALGATLGTR
jgi:hypothetical protein